MLSRCNRNELTNETGRSSVVQFKGFSNYLLFICTRLHTVIISVDRNFLIWEKKYHCALTSAISSVLFRPQHGRSLLLFDYWGENLYQDFGVQFLFYSFTIKQLIWQASLYSEKLFILRFIHAIVFLRLNTFSMFVGRVLEIFANSS